MKIILNHFKPYKKLIFLALLFTAVNNIFSLFDPYFFGRIIDEFGRHPFQSNTGTARTKIDFIKGVSWLIGLAIGSAMISRIAKAFQDYTVNKMIQKIGANLFTSGLKHTLQLDFLEIAEQSSGEKLSLLSKIRLDIEKFINVVIQVLFSVLVSIVFFIIYAAQINILVFPIFIGGSFIIGFITKQLSEKIKFIQKKIVKQTTNLAGESTETLRNLELIKSLGLIDQEISRLKKNTYQILDLELEKVKRIRSLNFIQGTLVNFTRQSILFTMMYLIFKNELTIGQLITLQFYSFFIFGPLQEIGTVIISFKEVQASLEQYEKLLAKPIEKIAENPQKLKEINNIFFQDISFIYPNNNSYALENINISLHLGETVAFVGPSGSGKTTLLKMLLGLIKPSNGNILFNHCPMNQMDIEYYRQNLGLVSQETHLFSGSIRDNLIFVKPQATDSELLNCLNQAQCVYLTQKTKDGLNTLIGEGGIKLSGGEKQRLSIARALLRQPFMLIFDEATSSLDSLTEEQLSQTIFNISKSKPKFTIIVAHRLSTIMNADKIYVLEKGKIIEQGTHSNLLSLNGLYSAMWRQQIGER